MQLLKLTHNSWSGGLLKELNSMRSTNQMCDIRLVLKDESTVAHSCVLAAASPFFRTILSGAENLEINLESFPSRIVIYMLDFIYSGSLLFPKEDLELLHSIASALNIPSLLDLTQEMLVHCTPTDFKNAKCEANMEQASSEMLLDATNEVIQISDGSVNEEKCSAHLPIAGHSLSNLPVTLNLVDVVESLDTLNTVNGDDSTQSYYDTENIQICVKDEEHRSESKSQHIIGFKETTEESQDAVNGVTQEHHITADEDQAEQVSVIKQETGECSVTRKEKRTVSSALITIQDKIVSADGSVPDRAEQTLPDGLSIDRSQINKSENGIYSTQLFPKGALFGPYQGKILCDVKATEQIPKRYLWKIYRNGKPIHWLSGVDESFANWMRYVQYTGNSQQQNLEAFQHNGELFFRATKDIQPYSELAVKYGNRQSTILGTANDKTFLTETGIVNGDDEDEKSLFRCEKCDILYTSEVVYHKHMHIKHSQSLPLHVYLQSGRDTSVRTDGDDETMENNGDVAENGTSTSNIRTRLSFRQQKSEEATKKQCMRGAVFQKSERILHHCDVCDRVFTSLGNLQKHKLIHSNERPYSCPVCGRAFVQKSNMKTHVKIHNDERRHVCSNCGKSFCRQTELRRHERFHSNEMPYVCLVCNRAFKNIGNLKRHQMCHTGEKPYKCSVCGRDFNRLENLKTHMRRHTGEKPFQCTLCGNCFTENAHLKIHMRRHSGEKPYACSICSKSFVDMTTLRVHQRVHEKEQCLMAQSSKNL